MPKSNNKRGETTAAVRSFLQDNPKATSREIAAAVGITKATVMYHLTKINKENRKHARSQRSSGEGHHGPSARLEIQQAYLLGTVAQLVRSYAESHQLPFGTLAEGVAAGLHVVSRGELLRT